MAKVKPHPSLTLVLDVDEALATQENRLEVNRCWAHVCSTVLQSHETPEGQKPVNTARFMVKMGTTKYLRSEDEGADEMWDDVVETWLYNMFHKVGNNMKIYNMRQDEIGNDRLEFDWLDVELENKALVVRIRLDSNSDVVPDTNKMVGRVRQALNAGAFEGDVACVQLPSDGSYAAQYAAGMAAKAQREAEAAAQAEAERIAEEEAAAAAIQNAAENFTESPDLTQQAQKDEVPDYVAQDRKALEERIKRYTLPEADFAIDYAVWTVKYADGTTRIYDSDAGAFLESDIAEPTAFTTQAEQGSDDEQ